MEPILYYTKRIVELQADIKKLQQKKSAFGWLRFSTVAGIIAATYFLQSMGIWYVIMAGVILLVVFIRLLLADLKNNASLKHLARLITINKNEVKILNGDYIDFAAGYEHITADHLYTNDLDIFGKASLFQYINRSTSEMGSKQLADYLQHPAENKLITERQTSVKELSNKIEWLQHLQAIGFEKQISFHTKNRLVDWLNESPVFSQFKPWQWLRYILPAIIISVVTLYIFDIVPQGVFYFSLLVYAIIAYQINKIVAPIHNKLLKVAEELDILSKSILHIEKENFKSSLLKQLQSTFVQQDKKISADIKKLKKLLDRLDLRYNIVLSAPLNILLLWNLQQILDLEKWKLDKQHLDKWFETLGHFEALNSISVLHFNEPAWAFPEIIPDYFFIEGKGIGHPLIPKIKSVKNNIEIKHNGELMLITGSNMAGKSTYLRSIGVNVILAMAGAPVCATYFKVSHVQIISSMRIADNLAESTSTFYAELKKLKIIIEKVNKGEKIFILLDEILRGTNSLDRHTGSVALMKQLIKHNAAAIIATHDLELASLKNEYPDNISNYHFDVQVSNDELFFDYVLKPGVCTSLNASILMKKIGIEL